MFAFKIPLNYLLQFSQGSPVSKHKNKIVYIFSEETVSEVEVVFCNGQRVHRLRSLQNEIDFSYVRCYQSYFLHSR